MNRQCEEKTTLAIKLLAILQIDYPFPPRLESMSSTFNNAMFTAPNFLLSSGIIHYILDTIDSERCGKLVPPPYDTKLRNAFNQGVMKFLAEIFKVHPNIKIEGLRVSTLATPFGWKFADFILQLASRSVKLRLPAEADLRTDNVQERNFEEGGVSDESESNQCSSNSNNDNEIKAYSDALQNLGDLKARLKKKRQALIDATPQEYKSKLYAGDPITSSLVYKDWFAHLNESHSSILARYRRVEEENKLIAHALKMMSDLKNPPTLDINSLITSNNQEIIRKVACDNQINLMDEKGDLSLEGFLKVTGMVSTKLALILKSSLIPQFEKIDDDLRECLIKLTRALSNMNVSTIKLQEMKEKLKPLVLNAQKYYDEIANELDLPHYSPILRDNFQFESFSPQEYTVISPGDSFIQEIAEMKERVTRQVENDCATPKSSNPSINKGRNEPAVSAIKLAKSVLCKQVVQSIGCSSESIMEDMVPLSTSSPVSAQEECNPLRVRPISNIAVNRSFSGFSDSFDLDISNSSFEGLPEVKNVDFECSSPIPETVPCAVPHQLLGPVNSPKVRRCRPSLECILDRFTKLKEDIKY